MRIGSNWVKTNMIFNFHLIQKMKNIKLMLIYKAICNIMLLFA